MKRTLLVLSMFIFMTANMSFGQRMPMELRGERGPRMQRMNFLELSETQQKQIEKLRLEFQKKISPLQDKARSLKNAYRLMVIDEKVSESGLKNQLKKISSIRQELALKRAMHKRQVRSLLTEEQKVKFDQQFLSGPKPGKRGAIHKGCGKKRSSHRMR